MNSEQTKYVAVYGTLRQGLGTADTPDVMRRLTRVGACVIAGLLYDLGDFPGVVPGDGEVVGELYMTDDPGVIAELDAYEQYNPADPIGSLYLRRLVPLRDPALDAWVYVFNQPLAGAKRIETGDWSTSRAGRAS